MRPVGPAASRRNNPSPAGMSQNHAKADRKVRTDIPALHAGMSRNVKCDIVLTSVLAARMSQCHDKNRGDKKYYVLFQIPLTL